MMLNRKNRNENGIRALFFGSNPHSNDEVFSRSFSVRALKAHAAPNVAPASASAIIIADMNRVMNQKYIYSLLIKS